MPREGKDLPPLSLKLRIRLTERMTKREALRRLKRTLTTGVVQPGIEVRWIDWASGEEGVLREGHYSERTRTTAMDALRDFYRAISHGNTQARVEVVT